MSAKCDTPAVDEKPMTQTKESTEETQARLEWLRRMQREGQPNHFELTGASIKVTYSSTSFAGVPQVTYEDAAGVQRFMGDEIRVLDSEIGHQITFSADRGRGTTITLLIPVFKLKLNLQPESFTTWAITTTCRGPDVQQLPSGALLTYRVEELQGVASKVYS
jgi:hypothetical protein